MAICALAAIKSRVLLSSAILLHILSTRTFTTRKTAPGTERVAFRCERGITRGPGGHGERGRLVLTGPRW